MIAAAVALLSTAAEICTAATAMAHGMSVVTGNLERVCFSWNRQRSRGAPFDTPRIESGATQGEGWVLGGQKNLPHPE